MSGSESDQGSGSLAITEVEAWLRGDPASSVAEFGLEAAPVVANRALGLIGGEKCPPLDVLTRLANHPDGVRLLMEVSRSQWEAVRDLLPIGPRRRSDQNDSARARHSPNLLAPKAVLSYVAVSFASNDVWATDRSELAFLVQAARYDAALLRHLLTWAAAQPEDNTEGWIVDDNLPTPKRMDGWIAQAVWWVLTRPPRRWNAELWEDEDAWYVTNRILGALNHTELIVGARAYGIHPYSLLGVLADETEGELEHTIRAIAGHPLVLDALPEPAFGSHASGWDKKVLPLLPLDTEERYLRRIGWSVGYAIHGMKSPAAVATVASLLGKAVEEVAEHLVCGLALLWAGVLDLTAVQGGGRTADQARSAVLARLARHRRNWPQAWELSIGQLVAQGDKISPEVFDLIVEVAIDNESTREMLRGLDTEHPDQAVRNRAGAILARVDGLSDTSVEARQWLGDQAARVFDGTPMFPQPLTTLARTWLGSLELEATLAGSVRRAADRFRAYVRDQGAWQEEGLLGNLLGRLEDAFFDANLILAFGKRQGLAGKVSVSQRPVTKNEETEQGCDLALLLNIEMPSAAVLRVVELVQVKKSEAFKYTGPGEPHEAWRIAIPQLRALIDKSQSAGYWLIRSSGEVLCVTARWLLALATGTEVLKQGSFTAGYNEIRHQAVPLEQYVTELMIGTWLGTTDEETLAFVSEGDPRIKPRHIFEITVAREGRGDR